MNQCHVPDLFKPDGPQRALEHVVREQDTAPVPADEALGPLLQPIVESAPPRRDTLVVLTADHGESLGEHGEMTHGLFAYEGTLRVPLIIYQPRLLPPRTIADPARHVDILPTVLDAIAAPVPAGLDGRSLLALASGAASDRVATYFESLSASINRGWAPLYGIVRGSLKYVDLPIPELYDLAADPGESRNVASARPADVRELQNLLAAFRKDDRRTAPARESAATREQLRSLGYVAGTAAARQHYTEADDPKRLVEIEQMLTRGGFERVTDYPATIESCLGDLKKGGFIQSDSDLAAVGFSPTPLSTAS
jgi:hypothetical protein